MTARLVMCVAFSAFAFVGIGIVDFIADRVDKGIEEGLRALLETLGILMGLVWEAAFVNATEGIVAHLHPLQLRTISDAGLNLLLCVVVGPAWAWYLLPNAHKEKVHAPKTLQCPHCYITFDAHCPHCHRALPSLSPREDDTISNCSICD